MRTDCVYDNGRRAGVAQSVEQRIRNAKVGGSIPFSGTRLDKKRPSENFSDGLFSCFIFLFYINQRHTKLPALFASLPI